MSRKPLVAVAFCLATLASIATSPLQSDVGDSVAGHRFVLDEAAPNGVVELTVSIDGETVALRTWGDAALWVRMIPLEVPQEGPASATVSVSLPNAEAPIDSEVFSWDTAVETEHVVDLMPLLEDCPRGEVCDVDLRIDVGRTTGTIAVTWGADVWLDYDPSGDEVPASPFADIEVRAEPDDQPAGATMGRPAP